MSFEPNLNNRSNALIDSRAEPDAKRFRGYDVTIAHVLKGDDSPISIPDEYLCNTIVDIVNGWKRLHRNGLLVQRQFRTGLGIENCNCSIVQYPDNFGASVTTSPRTGGGTIVSSLSETVVDHFVSPDRASSANPGY